MTSLYRHRLPQLDGTPLLTDGGIETTLIFHYGIDLPHFASVVLHRSAEGEAALERYFRAYLALARRHGVGLLLESATWRASADWGARLGCSEEELAQLNARAVEFLAALRPELQPADLPLVVSGCIGPRGDGYTPETLMSADEAEDYHAAQVRTFAAASADLVSALTMNYVEEAIGVTRAARQAGMPIVVSFTVETDGALATGQSLQSAIEQVDEVTGGWPSYYMINCAHPTHFARALAKGAPWCARIGGIRANASAQSHAELNESTTLDSGDPGRLAEEYARLLALLPRAAVLGGCCGTDDRHVDSIARVCVPLLRRAPEGRGASGRLRCVP